MGLRARFQIGLARQLGHPSGLRGRVVGRALNRVNQALVAGSVETACVRAGDACADIGFGGGVGLRALLDACGPDGQVHGVDVSTTMVDRARSVFAGDCAAGRLEVSVGSLVDLPLADAALDRAITTNTLYFLDDVEPAFREFTRVLRPGGRVVVGVGDPDQMSRLPVTAHGFHLRPVEQLLESMKAAGLSGVRSEKLRIGSLSAYLLVGEI